MFRIVCDPSSGSIELYLTEIRSGSLMFFVCLVGVCQRNFEPVVCVCVRARARACVCACVRYDGPNPSGEAEVSPDNCQWSRYQRDLVANTTLYSLL